MSAELIYAGIRDQIKKKISKFENRVWVLAGIEAFFLVKDFGLPGACIVPAPADIIHEKGLQGVPQNEYQNFTVHVFMDTPIEEAAVLGTNVSPGILALMEEVRPIILAYRTPTYRNVTSMRAMRKTGTKAWANPSSEGLAASTGILFECLENLTVT